MKRVNDAPVVLRLPLAAGRTLRLNTGDEGSQLFAASCDDARGVLVLNGLLLASFALCGMVWTRAEGSQIILHRGDTLTAQGASVRCWIRMPEGF